MPLEYPADFLDDCRQLMPDDYCEFYCALNREPVASLRLNPSRSMAASAVFAERLEKVPWEENGRYVETGFKPGFDPAHFAGGYYMQEASAMAPAKVLAAKSGERVLDLCAAPGGKSGQIAADLNGKGALISNEPNEKRAQMLAGNLERLGVTNCCVVCGTPANLALKWPEFFDAIIVDAPCSGEGMFRREEAARGEWSAKRVMGCAERQREILASAYQLLKPSGRLVYSTCTFNRFEDEENADWFADNFDVERVDFSLPGAGMSSRGQMKLLPHRVKGEGQFIALFKKNGESEKRLSGTLPVSKETLNAATLLSDAIGRDIRDVLSFDGLRLASDSLYAVSKDFPDMSGVKTFMQGVRLAHIKKGLAVPDHSLAMALSGNTMKSEDVDQYNARLYMAGEELQCDKTGWTLVTHMGMPLGFGKCSEGRMRNHLPKGLRIRATL